MPRSLYRLARPWRGDCNGKLSPNKSHVTGDLNLLNLRSAFELRPGATWRYLRQRRKFCFSHGRPAWNEENDILCHETKYGLYIAGLGCGVPRLNKRANLLFVVHYVDLNNVTPDFQRHQLL